MEFTERPLIGEISEADAREMINAYNTKGEDITKSVWFSLKQLDQLTTLLKAENLLGLGTDGIRVYFARYTSNTIHNMDASYLNRETVVFVSTKTNYDPATNEYFHEDYFDGLDTPKHSLPENRGELCQPQCTGTVKP